MIATTAAKFMKEFDDRIRQNPELLRTAQSAADFVKELVTETYPELRGDLTFSLEVLPSEEGIDFISTGLFLHDDFGGRARFGHIKLSEFLNPDLRERQMFRLWRNVLGDRHANIRTRLDNLEFNEDQADAQPESD